MVEFSGGRSSETVLTSDQEAAIIGRVVVARRTAETRLAKLKAESARVGKLLCACGAYMGNNVEYVWIDGVSTNENYPHPRGESFSVSDLDPIRIAKLTSEIRDVKDELKRLAQEARDLGL